MQHAVRRPLLAAATLTTAGALALTPITITPPDLHPAGLAPVRIATEAVQLTDAWSDLFADTATSVGNLVALGLGLDSNYPLPSPTFPLAPVASQLVLNQLIYVAKLFNGQAGEIPVWIGAHLTEVGKLAQLFVSAVPGVVLQQLQIPFYAAAQTLQYIANSGNPLYALFQAPAVFLNLALNNQFGLLGFTGPVGISLIFRNLLATALYTTPPAIVLPFKKAASTRKATATNTVTTTAPSGTASSARSKPKAPSSASSSKRKPASSAASATSDSKANSNAGRGHSKRG